ncbi:MAG: sugar phosphate isomerase/epimerase family protein [Planctomycetota bacterium]|jgi:sugar phosphate isomerase/epimerase
MNVAENLSVQSYCFRNFTDNVQVAKMIADCGLTGVELFGHDIHGDFQKPGEFGEVAKIYQDAGVEVVAIGVCSFANKPDEERKVFESAAACGAKFISMDFEINTIPDSLRVSEKLADEFDVKLGIHNHGGWHWLGNTNTLQWLFDQTSERVGLCLDTAWAMAAMEDPVKMAETFGSRLYGLHIKDFVFDRAGKPEDVVVGTGNLDMPALMATLDKVGFNGWAALEYEGDADNPCPAVTECVKAIRAL